MPQPTTAEYALMNTKQRAQRSGHLAVLAFNESAAIEFRLPRNLQGRKITTSNFGIREMSVEREALVKTPKFFAIALATSVFGVADGALAEQVKKLFFEGDLVRHTLENQKGPFFLCSDEPVQAQGGGRLAYSRA
jgi:hypothetical protein